MTHHDVPLLISLATTPHPSSILNNNAMTTLQTAADETSTTYQPLGSRALAALQFFASTSVGHHHSDQARTRKSTQMDELFLDRYK
jgi:hypothetical protein